MRTKIYLLLITVGLPVLFVGCAVLSPKPSIDVTHRPETCTRFFQQLTETVNKTGVSDADPVAIPGYPYLRTSRFLSAMANTVNTDEKFADWLNLVKQQAIIGFEKEIQNLPAFAIEKPAVEMTLPSNRSGLLQNVSDCATALSMHDETNPDFRKAVLSAAPAPTEYSRTMRILGLYPLASLPVAYLTHRAQKKFNAWFETPMEDLPVQGHLVAYGPAGAETPAHEIVRDIFEKAPENALHMTILDSDTTRKLAEALAPTLLQDVSGSRDVPGKVEWEEGRVKIDAGAPTVYYYLSYAVFKQQPIVQINYVAWFSGREGPLAPPIERGPLDGLTLRLSLTPEGIPFMLDIMNNCGCYHLFIPRKETVVEKKEKVFAIDAFIPQWLPDAFPALPLRIRVNSGWHQVQRVWAAKDPLPSPITYRLRPYDEIESLPHSDGRYESVFDARGIMKGSNRVEPFLLFSMGIPSVGNMRQRGHHAISLIGRDHFDDPDLFEKNFIFH